MESLTVHKPSIPLHTASPRLVACGKRGYVGICDLLALDSTPRMIQLDHMAVLSVF